jgi:hypothetical protein
MPEPQHPSAWRLAADRGGTFTDCAALTPSGEFKRCKVLSSGILRARIAALAGPQSCRPDRSWDVPDGCFVGWQIRFADGPHDVEAIYVAPDASIWLITKRPSRDAGGRQRPSRLYRVPAADWQGSPAVTAVAQVADSIPIVATTGTTREWITDAHLSGADSTGARRLAVLTYGAVYVFAADATTGRPGALVARCALPIRETSAEGLTWLPDGRLLIMNEGRGAELYGGRCP